MNHQIQTNAAEQSSRFYRLTCGMPVVVHSETGRILLTTGRIVGITMPSDRGQAVAKDMKDNGFALGPIVGHPRSDRWTFLVRPDLPNEEVPAHFAELFRLNITIVRNGAEIALPASRLDAFRYWVEEPRGTFRPSGSAVVDSIHRTLLPRVRNVS